LNKKAIASVAGALLISAVAGSAPAMAQSEVREDLNPGDRVARDGLAIEVGPRGTFTAAHATRLEGHSSLYVLTRPDGAVVVSSDEDADAGTLPGLPAAAAASPAPCSDNAYTLSTWNFSGTLKKFKWKSQFNWYFKANSTPGDVGTGAARTAVTEATGNITASRNDCGLADEVGATHSFVGDTTAAPDFNATGSACKAYGAKDGKSVVGWGTLPDGTLGSECTWGTWNGTDTYATATQSDVRLSNGYSWYAGAVPAVCQDVTGGLDDLTGVPTRLFSVEGVMTHERGHTFGVGHVDEATHGNLTMSTNINGACQDAESSLGLGDVRALRALY
jgi:hypothetical protein